MEKSKKFTLVLGVNEGYTNNSAVANLNDIAELYKETALKVMQETGVYVSCIMQDGKSLYNADWGCPHGGEPIIVFEGSLNPEFATEANWKEAVLLLSEKMKRKLRQTTATLEFLDTEYLYLKED